MTFGQFISILRARWWVAALVLGLTVLTTVVVSLVLPKQYTANASVVVDFKPDPVSAMLYQGAASPAFMATQVDVIASDRVAYRVVRNLKLNENPQIREQWQAATNGEGTIEAWLAETFKRNMDVRPSRESSVISISYKAPDPRFAAGLANAFVRAYIETSVELRVDPARQYSNFFDTRAKEAREALERAQSKLSDFQKENGITASDERLDVENARLNELSSQLVAIQALAMESSSRQAQAMGSSSDRIQEVLSNPLLSGLKADLSRFEAKLQELSARLGDKHPQVIEAQENIKSLRSKIEEETRRVTGGVGVSANINRQRQAELTASLEAQRSKVLKLKAVRDEASVLERDVESAQRAYEAVVTRFNQTTLESQSTQGNVNVLTEATPPVEPSSPRVLLNSILAVFVGALLATGTVLALELRNRRIRSADDLLASLGLPVLGVLPAANASSRSRRSSSSLMQQRLTGQLPAPSKAR